MVQITHKIIDTKHFHCVFLDCHLHSVSKSAKDQDNGSCADANIGMSDENYKMSFNNTVIHTASTQKRFYRCS